MIIFGTYVNYAHHHTTCPKKFPTILLSLSLFFTIITDVTYMNFNPTLLRFRFSFRRNRKEEFIERQDLDLSQESRKRI